MFLSLLPLGASVHQMPFYSRVYLNLLIGRVVHMTSDRLHEQCAAANFGLSSLCVIMYFDDVELEMIMYFKERNLQP